ncbi:MAG TPA: hypothetical protein VFF67_00610 [Thermoplasmata archaeon]|nr:hypothetical protein [Thermoplasmata archaeon]
MSRVGAVVAGYLHSPDPRAFARLAASYRNWPQVALARVGLRNYPLEARRRTGETFTVRKHTDVDLFAHREARWLPNGAELSVFERTLTFETEAPGALVDTYFRQHYRALPVDGRAVLDLGALDGDTAIYFVARGARHVLAVEINPTNAQRLRRNLEHNHIGNVTVVGEKAERIEPYLPALEAAAGASAPAGFSLKMDIEGDEEPLLENSAPEAIQRFRDIVLEYHRGPERCATRLRTLGYALRVEPPLRHPNGDLCGLIWAHR